MPVWGYERLRVSIRGTRLPAAASLQHIPLEDFSRNLTEGLRAN